MASSAASRPIRVLFVEMAPTFGGAVLSLSDLLKGFRETREFAPSVIAFQDRSIIGGLFDGFTVFPMKRVLTYVTRARYMAWTKRWLRFRPLIALASMLYTVVDYGQEITLSWLIFRKIRANGIDVLHLNNGPTRIGTRAASWAGVPVVSHLRGHGRQGKVIEREVLAAKHPSVAVTVAVSRSVAEDGVFRGTPEESIVVIHNPVDTDAFSAAAHERENIRRQYGFEEDDVVAGAFGRVMRYKGQENLMMAASPLFHDYPSLRLLIVGDSSDDPDPRYFRYLRTLAENEPFRDRVVFAGYQRNVAAYFAACDLVVHSSPGLEGFGRVVVEGMAASRPVIAMKEAGPLDIITDGVDGLLVPPRDREALSRGIRTLLASETLRRSMGTAGRRTAVERFSIPVIAEQLMQLYRELLREQS